MGVRISGRYAGSKKVELRHEQSGAVITTAAPLDNNGDGSSFSPTDLAASSLGACMLTVMAIVAERSQIDLTGAWFTLEKIMSSEPPRRIAGLPLEIHLPQALSAENRQKLERTALACPVHHSLRPDIDSEIRFVYDVQR